MSTFSGRLSIQLLADGWQQNHHFCQLFASSAHRLDFFMLGELGNKRSKTSPLLRNHVLQWMPTIARWMQPTSHGLCYHTLVDNTCRTFPMN
jgi:hypothetical protein